MWIEREDEDGGSGGGGVMYAQVVDELIWFMPFQLGMMMNGVLKELVPTTIILLTLDAAEVEDEVEAVGLTQWCVVMCEYECEWVVWLSGRVGALRHPTRDDAAILLNEGIENIPRRGINESDFPLTIVKLFFVYVTVLV